MESNSKIYLSEPVKLSGDGAYHMNDLTETKVTKAYLGLDQSVKDCQNEEPLFNCTTRNYHDAFLENCGCLPFNIRLSEKV